MQAVARPFTILLEMISGTDYLKMASLLNHIAEMPVEGTRGSKKMDRPFVKMLARECEFLRVAIVKASGISASKAQWDYGFERMDECTALVEESIKEAQRTREAVEELAQTQDKALMEVYGIVDPADSSDRCSESDEGKEPLEDKTTPLSCNMLSALVTLLIQSQFNWFELQKRSMDVLEGMRRQFPVLPGGSSV